MTYPAVPDRATSGKAVAALVVGIVSLVLSICCLGFAGIVAIFLGLRARREIRESHDRQVGDGLALAGIITGAVAAVVSTVLLVFVIVAIATGNAEFDVYRG